MSRAGSVEEEIRAPAGAWEIPGARDWPQHVCLCRDKLVGIGGAERVLIEQTAALVERGVRCTVVLFELAEELRGQLPREARVIVLGDCRRCDVLFLPKLVKLARSLRRLRPDCVIAHQSLADYLRWALMGTGIPYFLLRYTSLFYLAHDTLKYSLLHRAHFHRIRHSLPAYVQGVHVPWRAPLARRVVNEAYALRDWLGVRGARAVFTLTSQSQWELQQLYGIRPIIWTPGSAQAKGCPARDDARIRALRVQYGIRDGEPVVLSVNRLEYRKRIHVLVEAFRLLLGGGLQAKLVIVGDGEERSALERRVREAGLEGAVSFAGTVSEESLAQHYHMCDVAVAIIWGSWALSVVEPLIYGKKVVISDEIPDLLCDVPNVFRMKPEPLAVSSGLQEALSALGRRSSEVLLEQLDWSRQTEKLLGFIRLARNEPSARHAPVRRCVQCC